MHKDPYAVMAVMESPSQDRVRASIGSSTIIHESYNESNLDILDTIHDVYADGNMPHDLEEPSVMTFAHHELMKSPLDSVANVTTVSSQKQKYRVLGTLTLVSILFFMSCGGPVGSEPLVSSGGPLLCLLGIATYILLCQIPLSFMVTELCCAFPENGGYSVWVMTAFGPFWGFQVGYWSWIASVLNNAIYPGIIYSTIVDAYGIEATSRVVEFVAKVVIALVFATPSYIGVRFVGVGALVLLAVILATTLIFSVWGFADGNGAWFRLAEARGPHDIAADSSSGGIDWSLLVHTLFWNFDGIQCVSVIGGEVINPARTYPRVIVLAVSLTASIYLVTWISAVTADKTPWLSLSEDSLPEVANAVGGSFLHQLMVVSSVLSSVGMFTCTLFFQSFLIQGMAQSRLLPAILRKRHARFKTPQYAIHVSLLTTLVLLGFDFEDMLNMTNAFSGAVQVLVVLTMVQLRRAFPYLPRPVKAPGNTMAVAVMLIPAACVFLFVLGTTLAEWKLALLAVGFAVPGVVYPHVRHRLAGRTFC